MSQHNPNFQQFFALPAVYQPGMSEADWNQELERMFRASQLTHQFVEGRLAPEDYQDGLADLGENPYQLEDLWSEGISLL